MAKTPWKSQALDHLLIVDVESTCWEGPPPPGQESEIIEIGLCLLEVASGQQQGKRSLLVRPERYREWGRWAAAWSHHHLGDNQDGPWNGRGDRQLRKTPRA